MISPTDATIIDSRDAYPIDECVAKMLGWMQGSERLERIKVDERGILPEMLPHISRLVYTLDEHLDQLKERARLELFDAADAYADALDGTPEKEALSDIIDQKYIAIKDCAELIKKAHFYKSEIRKEIARNDQSQLKIDHVETDEDGVDIIFIKLDSLDDWAWEKYEIAIIDRPSTMRSVSAKSENYSATIVNNIVPQKPGVRRKLLDQEAAILESIVALGFDPKNLPKRDNGKPGIKFLVRTALSKNILFEGAKVFDKAWERLRSDSEIVETK